MSQANQENFKMNFYLSSEAHRNIAFSVSES